MVVEIPGTDSGARAGTDAGSSSDIDADATAETSGRIRKFSTLKNKLPKITSLPSMINVADGMTRRSIRVGSRCPNAVAPQENTAQQEPASPRTTNKPPRVTPASSVNRPSQRVRPGFSGNRPSATVKVLASTLGCAHCVEVWQGPTLVGGLYGVQWGGLFAGESMFHLVPDASKVAFAHLVAQLDIVGTVLFDCQVINDHTARLGAVCVDRDDYLAAVSLTLQVEGRFAAERWPSEPPPPARRNTRDEADDEEQD